MLPKFVVAAYHEAEKLKKEEKTRRRAIMQKMQAKMPVVNKLADMR